MSASQAIFAHNPPPEKGKGMYLKDFVSSAIVQITEGIIEAREALAEKQETKGARVAPPVMVRGGENETDVFTVARLANNPLRVWPLKFDVAITVSKQEGTESAGKLSVGFSGFSIAAGGENSHLDKNTELSRLSFVVPVLWPLDQDLPEPHWPDHKAVQKSALWR
jgi:hypothetical protein